MVPEIIFKALLYIASASELWDYIWKIYVMKFYASGKYAQK